MAPTKMHLLHIITLTLLLRDAICITPLSQQRTTLPFSIIRLKEGNTALSPLSASALKICGGAIDLDEDESVSVLVKKLRNIARSLTKSKEGPSLVRTVFGALESVMGVRLLPVKEKKVTKKPKRKRKKEHRSKFTKEEDLPPAKGISTKSSKVGVSKPKKTASKAATSHLETKLKSTSPNYRIQRELKAFIQDPPDHLKVKVGKNIRVWIVKVAGIGIYEGETFSLRVQFPATYPAMPPSVYFLPPNIPTHEHVYTNGDICLSLLGKDWRPTMTAQSVCHSILSILASASSKSLPMDNAAHAQAKPGQYQKDWVYHDDGC